MKLMMRRGDPLMKTSQAKLMRGESNTVAQNKKLSRVHSLRLGLMISPGK